jgi:hypothetical protein
LQDVNSFHEISFLKTKNGIRNGTGKVNFKKIFVRIFRASGGQGEGAWRMAFGA